MAQFQYLKKIKWNFPDTILSPLIFVLFYFYILLVIDPLLYYQQQQPVFFFEARFFNTFLTYPGGLTDYLSALLSQYYFIPWIGALIITVIAFTISLSLKGSIKSVLNNNGVYFIHLITAILILIMHQQYEHPLTIDIALLLSLLFYNIYYRLLVHKPLWRIPVFLVLAIILFYITSGVFFLFVVLAIILELLVRRRYELAAFYLPIAVVIPYVASKYFLLVLKKEAYTYLLVSKLDYFFSALPELLYIYIASVMLLAGLYTIIISNKAKEKIQNFFFKNKILFHIIQAAVLIGGGWYILTASNNESAKTYLQIQNDARSGKWANIISTVTPEMLNHKIVAFQFHRALYHSGKISDELFAYPQITGSEGLFLSSDLGAIAPLERSDLFFEMGFINEARHWAFEAVAVHGYTPWILVRLIEISILKGEKQFAKECINMLDKTLLFSDWTDHFLPMLKDESLISLDTRLGKIKPLVSKTDFVVHVDFPHLDLISLLKENQFNKMAFEYLMAYYLVTRQLNKFVENYKRISSFNYKQIPRHYEEAMLAYSSINKKVDLKIYNYEPSIDVNVRFKSFYNTLQKFKGDKSAARSTIQALFGKTYWCYLLYK